MKKIRTYGARVLRDKSRRVSRVDDDIIRLIEDMKKTMSAAGGVGLAACQIGIARRVFVASNDNEGTFITIINPEVREKTGEEIDMEGCLSFPDVFISIPRFQTIFVEGIDEREKPVAIETTGILARCVQHEMDHLDGTLIIDYATDEEKKYWEEKLEEIRVGTSS